MRAAPAAAGLEERLARIARRTFSKQSTVGDPRDAAKQHAASSFALDAERFPDPVLVTASATAGDRLRIAAELGHHAAPATDLVNACINEIAITGATPLFLDMQLLFVAVAGDTQDDMRAAVAEAAANGAATACRAAGCTLLKTHLASSAGLHASSYELSGFMTGACSRAKLISLADTADGDVLLGLPATGLHSSGNEAARSLLVDTAHHGYEEYVNALHSKVSAALLQPHRSYLAPIRKLLLAGLVRGFMHVSGTGLAASLAAVLPTNLRAHIDSSAWEPPPLFAHLRSLGGFTEAEMLDRFNMGIGLVAIVPAPMLRQAQTVLSRMNERCLVIGRILSDKRKAS